MSKRAVEPEIEIDSTHGRDEKYIRNFGRKTWEKAVTWET
jgi:hypothetical protein